MSESKEEDQEREREGVKEGREDSKRRRRAYASIGKSP